ncbi:MAG TPA: PEP-CTERM sorting domain-containing protein [Pyrinomonadaceae bacterium]|nr:PEP-CTERM sorting domain-containing protein [Pyrinomonadaceae bacterium]
MRIFSALCTLLLISVFTPSTTHADPLFISSGTLTVEGPIGAPHFTFFGTDFVVGGSGGERGAVVLQTGCFPCESGKLISVNAFFVGSSLGGGGITVNGMSFSGGFGGTFQLDGPLIQVPFALTNLTITSPFSFVGNLSVCPDSCVTRPPVFSVSLIGGGTATFDLIFGGLNSQGVPIFTFENITYNFEVPEPASILLFGAGLAALGTAIRHRRSRQRK